MSETSSAPPSQASALSIWPLQLETLVSTIAVMSFVALVGPISRALELAEWQAGATVTGAGVAWVVCARAWGAASDRRGRRRVMLFGIVGFAIAYALLCAAIAWLLVAQVQPWLAFAIVCTLRALAGAFYAAVPATCAALIADHVAAQGRAAAMAKLGAASAIGMVTGPGLAGLLAGFGLATPLYVTVLLPCLAVWILWRRLPADAPRAREDAAPLKVSDPRLRQPLLVAFGSVASVAVAQIIVGFFAIDRLHLSREEGARSAGIALTCVGVALIGSQLSVAKMGWAPAKMIRVGAAVSAIGFLAASQASQPIALFACYFVMAAGMGWVFPSYSALAANSVQAHEQGAAAGTLGMASGLGMILGPLVGTGLYAIDQRAPYLAVGSWLLLLALWLRPREASNAVDAAVKA